MGRVVVTGASGFIGRVLCAHLRTEQHEVVALQRGGKAAGALVWSLGDVLPDECRTADMVVHLASATLGSTKGRVADAADLDVRGTHIILEQMRAWRRDGGRRRFVFVSSQSSRPDAANSYGQTKWAVERLLTETDEIAIRPGLVYSEPPESVYAMFDKLSRLPLVPDLKTHPCIQPIGVGELAQCVARLVDFDSPPKILSLGSMRPLTFGDAVTATAKRAGRRRPVLVPVPLRPVRLVASLLDRMTGSTISERLNGVVGLLPMDTAPSLAALDQTLATF